MRKPTSTSALGRSACGSSKRPSTSTTTTSFTSITATSAACPARSGRRFPTRATACAQARTAPACKDSSGLEFELVATDQDNRTPWTAPGVGPEAAVRGLYSVTMVVRSPVRTLELVTGLLGFTKVNESDGRIRVGIGGDTPGHVIDIVSDWDQPQGVNGLGTVHHVTMAVATGDEQRKLRQELMRLGLQVTDIRDRCYFESIYFREPGGVLFEVATVDPGFLIDEPLPSLGQDLKLPPWEEPYREEIQ